MRSQDTMKSYHNITFKNMFYIKEPFTKNSPWILSDCKEKKVFSISKSTVKDIRNYHILGIDFLYQSYKKQFRGAILNEVEGMNMELQVASFFNALLNYVDTKFLVLIITPEQNIVNWHYHLTVHGGLKVQIVTPKTCPEDFDEEHGLALLLPFANLKLSEYLVDYDFSSVVIDDFDEVATKLVIKKLHGRFNVGLTKRNFYTDPDQKLQWNMLNWCNPGSVGKLNDFYRVDNDNFASFRDNYTHWWLRLTWNFCETFKEPTKCEIQEYNSILSKWSVSNHLMNFRRPEKATRKRKQVEIIEPDQSIDSDKKKRTEEEPNSDEKTENEENTEDRHIKEEILSLEEPKTPTEPESQSSDTTVIYELEKERGPKYVELPSMDENPILNSIIRNLEKSPDPRPSQNSAFSYSPVKYNVEEPNCSKVFEEDDVLLSIIDDKLPVNPVVEEVDELEFKKEELRSQIFNEEPCTSKVLTKEEDSQFFQEFIDSDGPVVMEQNEERGRRNDDIEAILRETEQLLK